MLEERGHSVTGTSNGKLALKVLKDSIPDLIITDILMPEMDGFDLCRKIKSDPELSQIPLIFYTATYTDRKNRELGLLMGASRFIIKPQEPNILLELIEEVIKEHSENKLATPTSPYLPHEIIDKKQLETVSEKLQQKVKALENEKAEKAEMSSKLIQLASDFQHINEALSDFTFSASHDLMEPLRKISSFSSRLREICGKNPDENQQVYLSAIENSSMKMKSYIEDLGAFAEISKANLDFRDIKLDEIYAEVIGELSLEIKKSKATFTIESPHDLVSDRSQLTKLFKIIISNSLKFKSENSPPKIHIRSKKIEDDFIEVSIEDSGIGFDDKYIDRIFKPFQKVHRDHRNEGSGMGLAICKKIVVRLGGTISAKSSPGKGATFTVRLPSKPENEK